MGTREETVSEALVKEDAKCIGTSEGVLVFVFVYSRKFRASKNLALNSIVVHIV